MDEERLQEELAHHRALLEALLAGLLPADRAASVNPATALRAEEAEAWCMREAGSHA